jgi:hypothetical protein
MRDAQQENDMEDPMAIIDIECGFDRNVDHFDNPYRRDPSIEIVYICAEPEDRMIAGARSEIFFDRQPYYNGHPRSIRETRRSQKRGSKR